jgi:hypothetical protein
MSDQDKQSNHEVLIHLEYIREALDAANEHLARLNGRTGGLETRVAVLEERSPGKQGGIAGAAGGALAGFLAGLLK